MSNIDEVISDSTAQKMKFSIKDFLGKCDQIRSFLRIWSDLLKKSLMENFFLCTVALPSRAKCPKAKYLLNPTKVTLEQTCYSDVFIWTLTDISIYGVRKTIKIYSNKTNIKLLCDE